MIIDERSLSEDDCISIATHLSENYSKIDYHKLINFIKVSSKLNIQEKNTLLRILERINPNKNFDNSYIGFN